MKWSHWKNVRAVKRSGTGNVIRHRGTFTSTDIGSPVSDAKFKKMADTLMSIVREGKHHGLAFTLPEDGRDVCCIWTPGVPISFKEADSESE